MRAVKFEVERPCLIFPPGHPLALDCPICQLLAPLHTSIKIAGTCWDAKMKASAGKRPSQHDQAVDHVTFRDPVSSEDNSYSAYQWDSQEDPYAFLVEETPSQVYAQPPAPASNPDAQQLQNSCAPSASPNCVQQEKEHSAHPSESRALQEHQVTHKSTAPKVTKVPQSGSVAASKRKPASRVHSGRTKIHQISQVARATTGEAFCWHCNLTRWPLRSF